MVVLALGVVFLVFFLLPNKTEVVINPTETEDTETYPKEELLGKKADLVSFSILPNSKIHDIVNYEGSVKGGYFFEANILINILDKDQNVLRQSNAISTTEWMTAEPVSFAGSLDLTGLPLGLAYIEIHNNNASGLPENDKSILIPIVIE